MKFTKIQGAGNDFIIINNIEEKLPAEILPRLARTLCKRKMSIGADGLMVVGRPQGDADFRMCYFNSDGTPAEMCGNGVRCIARYGYEKKLAGEIQHIETAAGPVTGWRCDRRRYMVRLNDPTVLKMHKTLDIDGKSYVYSYVELGSPGVPHAVVRMRNPEAADRKELLALGRTIRYHKDFEKGCNVTFFDVNGKDEISALTYERGVEDFTYACGTGTGSVVCALAMDGEVSGNDVRVSMPGGVLSVSLDMSGSRPVNIRLTGPTNIVAEGEVTDEDL